MSPPTVMPAPKAALRADNQPPVPAPVPAPSESAAIISMIARVARDQSIDLDRMDRLMAMHARIVERDAKLAFDAAFAAMQPALPVVTRRGTITGESRRTGDRLNQSYGRWEDISQAIMPVLAKHGFAIRFRQEPVLDAGGAIKTRITCILSHSQGHREEAFFDLPLDTTGSKNNVQAYGSTASYGRRYSAMLALNIVTKGEDDDGAAAGQSEPEFISAAQVAELERLIRSTGGDVAKFCIFAKVPQLANIYASRFEAAKAAILRASQQRRAQR